MQAASQRSLLIYDLDQQDELHDYFKKYRAKGGWMNSWQRQNLQTRRQMRYG